jgi:uncharacterized protein (TIGR00299 family) protein
MRIAYLDCFAGISGDMFLGALLDAGVPPHILHDTVAALHLGATLQIEKVDRSGITSTKVHVLENGHLAEAHTHEHTHTEAHSHTEASAHTHTPLEQTPREDVHQHHPKTQHLHKTGHPHTHAEAHSHAEAHTHDPEPHEHAHGRSLTVIGDLIRNAPLAEPVKNFALHTFDLLGASEAKIHNVPVDDIHFHEVGGVDAIVDIVCASAGIHHLNQQAVTETGEPLRWHSSPLNVGGGTVQCAHGNFPVPAPATADLLRSLPTYSAHLQKELVTPTGAALIRALAPTFGPQPAMRVDQIGYGAGTRNPAGFPNVLRLSLGEFVPMPATFSSASHSHTHGLPATFGEGTHGHVPHADTVTVLETALDDLSPQILAHVTEQALALGALDVMTTAVGMKKSRPGTLITVLTDEAHSPALERLLLRETSTLGIRVHQQRRICLARQHRTVTTPFGDIRIKIGSFDNEALNAAPEFEDCRSAALAHNAPVKQVLQAAIAAYINEQQK